MLSGRAVGAWGAGHFCDPASSDIVLLHDLVFGVRIPKWGEVRLRMSAMGTCMKLYMPSIENAGLQGCDCLLLIGVIMSTGLRAAKACLSIQSAELH